MNSEIMNSIGIDPAYYIIGIIAFVIILLILIIVQQSKLSKMKKKLAMFLEGNDGKSLEDQFKNKFARIDELEKKVEQHSTQISEVKDFEKLTFSKIGIVKYDAFKEMGGNMSFSLALLNEKNDGYIMNSMHSREGCYTYIKEIIDGKSYIELSEEEKEALENAVNQRDYLKQI